MSAPEEVVAVVARLTGPDAHSVTGQTIDAEGGLRPLALTIRTPIVRMVSYRPRPWTSC